MTIRMEIDFVPIIKAHMEQQPNCIRCNACGCELNFKATVDNDYDLTLYVDVCENCMEVNHGNT